MNNIENNLINELNNICVLCWGELRNKKEIEKICGCIIESQKEEWLNSETFFYESAIETNKKYSLLINDKFEILYPQIYFLQTLSIFKEYPIVSFIYTDYYNKTKINFLPSFKPSVGILKCFSEDMPLFIESKSLNLLKKINEFNIKTLSENRIGYHLAEPLFKYYE